MARKINSEPPFIPEVGREIGYYTILGFSHHSFNKKGWKTTIHVNVKCRCGTVKTTPLAAIRAGVIKSCGCWAQELIDSYTEQRKLNNILHQYIETAARASRTWSLTNEQAFTLFQSSCIYCGSMTKRNRKHKKKREIIELNGIDRLDSSKGYTPENCVPCCKNCNRAKNERTVEEFVHWIQKVKNNLPTIKNLLDIHKSIEGIEHH